MKSESEYQPLISIIIAVYNGEKYITQTIESIISQDYKKYELIIVDGGSTDKTCEILQAYEHYFSIFISEPDKGIYDAWNKGIKASKGDWISFIGCDDILLQSSLRNYVDHIKTNSISEFDFISSRIQFVTSDLKPKSFFGKKWDWKSHKVEMRVAHVGALHNRSLFTKYGYFDCNFKIAGDYELLLRPKHKLKASFMNRLTILMRQEGLSNTSTIVFKEALRAKIQTANRNKFICNLEHSYLLFKYHLLKLLRN